MKSIFTEFSKRIYRVHKVDFDRFNITDEVNRNNLQILKVGSFMMSLVFLIMFLLSFLVADYENNRLFYFCEMLTTVIIYSGARLLFHRRPKLILPAIYFFAAGLYYYGMHIGIVTSTKTPAVTLCLVLAVMPLLFIDGAMRIILFSTLISAVSMLLIYMLESDSTRIIDLTDIFFSWITGIALAVEVNRIKITNFVREREIAMERDTDGLTGLFNKDSLVREISAAISEVDAKGAFFIMDLDKFKQINDEYGHSFGDEVLVKTAGCIEAAFRREDITGRFGGDEFIFYVHGADADDAMRMADKLLLSIYRSIRLPAGGVVHGSIGIAAYTYKPDMSYDNLMKMADKALYVTKKEGRFGYTVYSEKEMKRNGVEI